MRRAVTALVIVNVVLTLYVVVLPYRVVVREPIVARPARQAYKPPMEFDTLKISLNGRAPTVRALFEEAARASGRLPRINMDLIGILDVRLDQEQLTPWIDGASVSEVLQRIAGELRRGDDSEKLAWSARDPGFLDLSSRWELDHREVYSAFYDVRDLLNRLHRFDAPPGSSCGGGCGGVVCGNSVAPSRLALAFRTLLGRNERDFQETVDELVDLLTEAVAPEDWRMNGGDLASLNYVAGQFLIIAPPRIHAEIEAFLQELDETLE